MSANQLGFSKTRYSPIGHSPSFQHCAKIRRSQSTSASQHGACPNNGLATVDRLCAAQAGSLLPRRSRRYQCRIISDLSCRMTHSPPHPGTPAPSRLHDPTGALPCLVWRGAMTLEAHCRRVPLTFMAHRRRIVRLFPHFLVASDGVNFASCPRRDLCVTLQSPFSPPSWRIILSSADRSCPSGLPGTQASARQHAIRAPIPAHRSQSKSCCMAGRGPVASAI